MGRAITLSIWSRLVRGERIDASALIDPVAVHIGIMPSTLRDHDAARNNTTRHERLDTDLAGRALHCKGVTIGDTARLRISRIDPERLRCDLLELFNESIRGMCTALVVKTTALQRIFV